MARSGSATRRGIAQRGGSYSPAKRFPHGGRRGRRPAAPAGHGRPGRRGRAAVPHSCVPTCTDARAVAPPVVPLRVTAGGEPPVAPLPGPASPTTPTASTRPTAAPSPEGPGGRRQKQPPAHASHPKRGQPPGNIAPGQPSAAIAIGESRASRGYPPGKALRITSKPAKAGENRATPGGYGGKPPGVAFIGVPTGARNAGRCSDGGPEHRYACYYETPPCASRPDYESTRRGAVFSNRGT